MPITYDRAGFFNAVRGPVFHGHMTDDQVGGCDTILTEWERLQSAGDTRFLAYMLATAYWETAHTMEPIEEIGHGHGRAYGAPAGPWHQVYDGRGFEQLTWYANYRKADNELHMRGILAAAEDLTRTPALAMRPDVAAAIMFYGMMQGWFTGKKLSDYFHGTSTDWVGARRIINGTDHDTDVAAIAEHFFAALKGSIVLAAKPAAPVSPKPSAPTRH